MEEPLEIIWSNPTLQVGSALLQGCVQLGFEYLRGWRVQNLYRQPVAVLDHPLSKKVWFSFCV